MRPIQSLAQGDHVCAVYESPDDQIRHLAEYIRAGLNQGERCLYIVDDRSAAEVLDAIGAAGVDVPSALANQRLVMLTKRESYLKDGSFNPDAMIFALAAMTDQAIADGCSGLRVTGEMTWALGPETGCDRLIEYESKLNDFFPGSRAHAICQYNRSRFPPAMIRDVLRTHPWVVMGDALYASPYYEPPDIARLGVDDPRRLDYMLSRVTGQS
jgi:hypothetical protein